VIVAPSSSVVISAPAANDSQLRRATSDFETMLLASWLEQMRESYSLEKDEESMAGGDNLNALATQAVASAISTRGGIGIGRMMYDRLRKS
jgi:Rod binding domain-containing protein